MQIGIIRNHPQLNGRIVTIDSNRNFSIDGVPGEIALADFYEKIVQPGLVEFTDPNIASLLAQSYAQLHSAPVPQLPIPMPVPDQAASPFQITEINSELLEKVETNSAPQVDTNAEPVDMAPLPPAGINLTYAVKTSVSLEGFLRGLLLAGVFILPMIVAIGGAALKLPGALVAILAAILYFIVGLVIAGYFASVMRSAGMREEYLPPLRFGNNLADGAKMLMVSIMISIPVVGIALLAIFADIPPKVIAIISGAMVIPMLVIAYWSIGFIVNGVFQGRIGAFFEFSRVKDAHRRHKQDYLAMFLGVIGVPLALVLITYVSVAAVITSGAMIIGGVASGESSQGAVFASPAESDSTQEITIDGKTYTTLGEEGGSGIGPNANPISSIPGMSSSPLGLLSGASPLVAGIISFLIAFAFSAFMLMGALASANIMGQYGRISYS